LSLIVTTTMLIFKERLNLRFYAFSESLTRHWLMIFIFFHHELKTGFYAPTYTQKLPKEHFCFNLFKYLSHNQTFSIKILHIFLTFCPLSLLFHHLNYFNDRLKNLVFLSPSLCTKQSILFGRGKLNRRCVKGRQVKNLASDLKNEINIICYTESQALRLHKFTIKQSLALVNCRCHEISFMPVFSVLLKRN